MVTQLYEESCMKEWHENKEIHTHFQSEKGVSETAQSTGTEVELLLSREMKA